MNKTVLIVAAATVIWCVNDALTRFTVAENRIAKADEYALTASLPTLGLSESQLAQIKEGINALATPEESQSDESQAEPDIQLPSGEFLTLTANNSKLTLRAVLSRPSDAQNRYALIEVKPKSSDLSIEKVSDGETLLDFEITIIDSRRVRLTKTDSAGQQQTAVLVMYQVGDSPPATGK